jgi:ribosomal protein L37AE/L43A
MGVPMTEQTSPPRCLRCRRRLTARASVGAGYGRTCRARIAEGAQVADLATFHPWQIEKAREAIEQQAIVPLSRPGLFAAVSGDGSTTYLVDTLKASCTCRAAAHGRACYHLAGALILHAAAPALSRAA